MQFLLVHVMNKTYLEEENLTTIFGIYSIFEVIFSFIAVAIIFFALYTFTKIPRFHKNLLWLIYLFGFQYFFSALSRAVIVFLQFYYDFGKLFQGSKIRRGTG